MSQRTLVEAIDKSLSGNIPDLINSREQGGSRSKDRDFSSTGNF